MSGGRSPAADAAHLLRGRRSRSGTLDTVWGHRYVTASTLNRVIALARRAFGDDADDPQFIQTVHGSGYRYVGPFDRPADLAVTVEPPARMRLPIPVEALIGREGELAQLTQMLSRHRAVTVLGTGGMGKTHCALELARRVAPEYRDGAWFFDLAPLSGANEWLRALATALSIRRAGQGETLAEIGRLLTGRHLLIVLDNCDRIAAETGEIVLAMPEGCAYIAAGLGRCSEAAELLGIAAQLRERTGVPLFRFWLPHHERAHLESRRVLGQCDYEERLRAGRAIRDEDAVTKTDALLREFAALPGA